mgnify:CR=1 FL=1
MKKINNSPKRNAYIWAFLIPISIFIIFLPSVIGLDGFDGGYALSIGGVLLTLTAAITSVIYFRMAKVLDETIKEDNLLAYWAYSPEQWQAYLKKDYQEQKASKIILFLVVAAAAVIAGIVLFVMFRDNLGIIVLIVLSIILLAAVSAFLSVILSRPGRGNIKGEAYITSDAVYLNKRLHMWKGLGNQLEDVKFSDSKSLPLIRIKYSTINRGMRNIYTVRVPVPPGEKDTARLIAETIADEHLQNGLD